MRIGIVGAGQLGRMMALAGIPLGIEFTMYDTHADVPGAAVADIVTGKFDDLKKLARFAKGVDVVTFDWENVPVASARAIARLRPGLAAAARTRGRAGSPFREADLPALRHSGRAVSPRSRAAPTCARDRGAGSARHPEDARLGYDGKGPGAHPARRATPRRRFERLGGQPLIYERFVNFTREVSLVAARDRAGRVACYPLVENEHENGILAVTRAPYVDARAAARGRAQPSAPVPRARLRRRPLRRTISSNAAGSSPTRWRRASTTPGTGPSRAPRPASSRTTFARSRVCRSAARSRAGTRSW